MWLRIAFFTALVLFALPLSMIVSGTIQFGRDWRTADRASAGIAPDPAETPEAVVQVYSARAINWRGLFGVHTWIATKPEGASHYTVHQVIGWRIYRNLSAVVSAPGIPDGYWFGNPPAIIAELRGAEASRAIEQITDSVSQYPYPYHYRLWPGPNSNTFTAFVARHVPELKVHMPVTAIGKDFPTDGILIDRAPSGTGFQVSLFGLLGVLVARQEGVEVNVLGLSFGIDVVRPALKLPFVGRLGW
ncbi:MAG: DUF3750 domain-containing protein [Deltaproteobacteria bacterium]|nr:DUF3750 domain-containing protein [Deltaproteobacteria bacterium]